MIDWLRRDRQDPAIEVAGRNLPIALRRHPRARRLTMRLAPDGSELRITLPRWGRTSEALEFAAARREWIAAQLARVPERRAIAPGGTLPFRGRDVRIEWRSDASRMPLHAEDALVLGGPRDAMEARLRRWLERSALDFFGQDLDHYCARAGHPRPALRLSRARRRWGSCAAPRQGEACIRINWRLIMAPDNVRRSVVAHEVAHLSHFDHSPAFHAHLADLFDGDLAQADDWLRREGRSLYAQFA